MRIKVEISSKGGKSPQLSVTVQKQSILSPHSSPFISAPAANRNQTADDHRKRTPIDLDHTEGVFSQQGLLLLLLSSFPSTVWTLSEPLAMHPYVDQLPQHMTSDRPKTAISKREGNTLVFDENDDAAELLPD